MLHAWIILRCRYLNVCERWLELKDKLDIHCIWPSKEDDRDVSEAERTCCIVEKGLKKGLCQQNLHPVFWIWVYDFFLWCANRLATVSNSALRSPDGDQSRPLEDFTFGLYSRARISRELCSATPPGTPILAKVQKVRGSSLGELRSEWLVTLCMHQDQVIASTPGQKRREN